MLSVIIITRNESANITDCLSGCAFADERIVVDSGSTDNTVALAEAAGATVIVRSDWEGFGVQKNRALAAASGDWILSLDADERVPPELATEICATVRDGELDGYRIRTETEFYGRRVRFSEFYANADGIRLFRRSAGQFTDSLVHENVALRSGRSGRLRHPLRHLSYVDPEAYLRKITLYARLQADMLYARGRRASYGSALVRSGAAFFKSYVIRLGFLDGTAGLMVAVFAAEMTYHKYFRLMLLSRNARIK